jgi:adenylate cyclase
MSQTRRLTAVLAADVVGYSRLIGADEAGTLQAFKTIKLERFDPMVTAHHRRLVKTTGDGFFVEFGSVGERCAARPSCKPGWPGATPRWPPLVSPCTM